MKITYNLSALPERSSFKGGAKSEEVLALVAFLADSTQKNMKIEYEDEKTAKRRYDTIRGYRLNNKLQEVFDLYRPADDKTCIIIVKTRKPGRKPSAHTE